MNNQIQLIIKSVLDSWFSQVQRTGKLLDGLTDEQLQQQVAPHRNRGIYLLGHLVAVHDRMLPLLNLGEQMYPELDSIFLTSPDKAVAEIPSAKDLRLYWITVNTALEKRFSVLQPEEWLEKHTAVSESDFVKEPHRNRLNVILSRTNHLSYHFGQLAFLKS